MQNAPEDVDDDVRSREGPPSWVLQQIHPKRSEDDYNGIEPSSIFRSFQAVAVLSVAAEPGPVDHRLLVRRRRRGGTRRVALQHCYTRYRGDGVEVVLRVVRRSTATRGGSGKFKMPTVARAAAAGRSHDQLRSLSKPTVRLAAFCSRSHSVMSMAMLSHQPELRVARPRRKEHTSYTRGGRVSVLQPRRRAAERLRGDHVHDQARDDARRLDGSS